MAVVWEYTNAWGVHIRVHDDAYVGISEEELNRRKRAVSDAINRVNLQLEREAQKAPGDARTSTEGQTK